MTARLNYHEAAPDAFQAILELENYVQGCGLPARIIHLIKLRASIINGCAFCVDMHVKEARRSGLSEQWINLVSVWHEAIIYTDEERALLEWTDSMTLVSETGVPDEAFEAISKHFSQADIVRISVAISTINAWNRLAIGFRSPHPIDKT